MLIMETDEANMALAAGYDPSEPAEFLEEMLRLKDSNKFANLQAYLEERGLTVGQVYDLMAPAIAAEANHDKDSSSRELVSVGSPEARAAIIQLAARSFPTATIARLLELDVDKVERFLSSRGTKVDEQRMVQLHCEGQLPADIAGQLGTPRSTVVNALTRLGFKPHTKLVRLSPETAEQVLVLRARGKTRPQICEKLGVRPDQVDNVVRAAARKGLVAGYGKKAGV